MMNFRENETYVSENRVTGQHHRITVHSVNNDRVQAMVNGEMESFPINHTDSMTDKIIIEQFGCIFYADEIM